MIVDDSYTAWARPTRRVHFALSAGMTLTGVILIAVGAFGDRSAAPLSPALGRTAHNVVNGGDGTPGSVIPPAPLLPFLPLMRIAPPVTAKPVTAKPTPALPSAKEKAKLKPKPTPELGSTLELKPEPKLEPKPEPKLEPKPEPKLELKPGPEPDPKLEPKPEPKSQHHTRPRPRPRHTTPAPPPSAD